jgi:hypothetical protein
MWFQLRGKSQALIMKAQRPGQENELNNISVKEGDISSQKVQLRHHNLFNLNKNKCNWEKGQIALCEKESGPTATARATHLTFSLWFPAALKFLRREQNFLMNLLLRHVPSFLAINHCFNLTLRLDPIQSLMSIERLVHSATSRPTAASWNFLTLRSSISI